MNNNHKPGVQGPHDKYFRKVFSQIKNAASMLRGILLPVLVRCLDWSTLTLPRGSEIDAVLQERRGDPIYQLTLEGRDLLVYIAA